MRLSILAVFFATFVLGPTASLRAQKVQLSERHVYILQESVDGLFGTYLFLVQNPAAEEVTDQVRVMLPKGTVDFQPAGAIGQDQLRLDPEKGGLILEKSFSPGERLHSVRFKVDAEAGRGHLEMVPSEASLNLSFFIQEGSILAVSAAQGELEVKKGVPVGRGRFDTYSMDLKGGESYSFYVDGIPEGRGQFWWLGALAASVLVLAGAGLAIKTRPKGSA